MKLKITHPYKDNLNLNFGQFTQIIGSDYQLKYDIWQIVLWYFGGKKYSQSDLTLFQQVEPEVLIDGELVNRTYYDVVSISSMQELLDQMEYKKGTLAYDYAKTSFSQLSIMSDLEKMNEQLEKLVGKLNQVLRQEYESSSYRLDCHDLTAETIISKQLYPSFYLDKEIVSFPFLPNETKCHLFLQMLEALLLCRDQKILLLFRNLDDYLGLDEFLRFSNRLEMLTKSLPNLFVILFPSQDGYLLVNETSAEQINILGTEMGSFFELDFLYERYMQNYPSNDYLGFDDFKESLRRISAYLLTEKIDCYQFSSRDLVTLKIINDLYQFSVGAFNLDIISNMESSYLEDD